MTRLAPLLLASLLSIPGVFAESAADTLAKQTRKVPAAGAGTTGPPAAAQAQAGTQDEALFDRFIGTWDVGYEVYDKDGKSRPSSGQVTYSWILDGQALQETWTSDSHRKEPKPFGTSIIFYDSKGRHWTEVWIYPALGMTTIVTGGQENGRIVLTGHDADGAMLRWSFNDIKPDSFVWRGEISSDEGKTWKLQGENHIHRRRLPR